ncbi:MAG: outer rane transport energization protein TonB [Cytophagaceae bacterium]|jgi:outer membrane biosynthesis protein TonB|nr:outer rane transport energization protein TonB [Cytophagaceae bacterium]
MHINYQTDEKYNNKGLLISLAIHGALLLGFFFIIVMKNPPDIPLQEDGSGVPINFGFDDFGMGDNNEQPSVEQAVVTPIQQEQQEEVAKQAEADESEVVTTTEETPYKIEDKKEKKKVKETPKITEPVKDTKESKPAVTETKATPKLDKRNSMGNGDKDKAGDQGKETGTLDSKNYYGTGNSGTGGDGTGGFGTGLNMSGWRWTSAPKVKDNSGESGKIVFKITVDEDGKILSAIPVENQLSPAVTKVYKAAVEELTLEKTSLSKAADTSVGYITFIIRAK